MSSPNHSSSGHEIVFGLVGAIGTDLARVSSALEAALRDVNYNPVPIHVSALFADALPDRGNPERRLDIRYKALMDAGDTLRELVDQGDAAALLAMLNIRERRKTPHNNGSTPTPRTAYILRQLKHPAEVGTLRHVYGPGFFLIAAYSPRDRRLERLVQRIEQSYTTHGDHRRAAEDLVARDEKAQGKWGQNVRDTFPLADVFIDAQAGDADLRGEITRFVELLFGYPFHTPTRDENAMFHAHAAGLRSAEMGRQVGASITTTDGDIIAVGTNEVPKYGGGTYWPPSTSTDRGSRDFTNEIDTSDLVKRKTLGGAIKWLNGSSVPSKKCLERFRICRNGRSSLRRYCDLPVPPSRHKFLLQAPAINSTATCKQTTIV